MNRIALFLLIIQICAPTASIAMVTQETNSTLYKPVELVGTLVTLQSTSVKHCAGIRATLTPDVCHAIGWTASDIQGMGVDVWILKQEHDNRNGSGFAFTLFDAATKDIVGILSIYPHKSLPTHAMVSGWIGERYWKQGHYKEALALALEHLFTQRPAITTFIAPVKPNNTHALEIYKAYGFKATDAQPTDTHIKLIYIRQHKENLPTATTSATAS